MKRFTASLNGNNQLLLEPAGTQDGVGALLFETHRCLVPLPVALSADGSAAHFRPTATMPLRRLSGAGVIQDVAPAISELVPGDTVVSRLEPFTGSYRTDRQRIARSPETTGADTQAFAGLTAWLLGIMRRCGVELGTSIAIAGMGTEGKLLTALCSLAGARPVMFDTARERIPPLPNVPGMLLLDDWRSGAKRLFNAGLGADIVFLSAIVADARLWKEIFALARPGGRLVILQEQDIAWSQEILPPYPVTTDFAFSDRMWDDWDQSRPLTLPHGYARWTTANNLSACVRDSIADSIPLHILDVSGDEPAAYPLPDSFAGPAVLLRFR